jgi:hypothetical protein
MSLPRFTSGRVGKLSFQQLNEMFDRLEALELKVDRGDGANTYNGENRKLIVLLKLTSKHATLPLFDFTEMVLVGISASSVTYVVLDGGRTSSDGANLYAYPFVSTTAAVGDLVAAIAVNQRSTVLPDGGLCYLPVGGSATPSTSTTFAAKVTASSGTAPVFSYTCIEVEGSSFGTKTGAVPFAAKNGAEVPTDATGSYGVGFSPPTAVATLVRKAIKVGTVVMVTKDGQGTYKFNCVNGYGVTCA